MATRKRGYINSMLQDDLLAQILSKVDNKEDRKSFSEVCKQWLSVERLTRPSLRVLRPMFPLDLLPRFPNLVDFRTTREVTKLRKKQNKQAWYCPPIDTRLEFIAKTCPKLETFMVSFHETTHVPSYGHLGTKGLRALVIGRPKLSRHVSGEQGLGFLANAKTLKKLILEHCDGITDTGIQLLVNLGSLEHLELASLNKLTDTGGVAILTIQTLRELKLSEIWKLSDRTVVALAENCRNLEVLVLDRIRYRIDEPVTGASLLGHAPQVAVNGLCRPRNRLRWR
ncbi:hypothetical protein ACLB2K_021255 [Fragaria x ananassa]